MPSPVSPEQIKKLLGLLGNPSGLKLQTLLDNGGDLLKQMIDADLTRVDRSAFETALIPISVPIDWWPVSKYVGKISEWNEMRHWGLTQTQIDAFAATLVDHLDSAHPTGISLWLGHDLAFNWDEALACLEYEVEALGMKFTKYVESDKVSFFPGSEQSGEISLTVALLDIATYWDPINGVVPREVRTKEGRLPGLEVVWLLALNPQVYLMIDYETVPGLIAAGLVIDLDDLPYFRRDPSEVFVYDYPDNRRWGGRSVVVFRR
jgi:hypothetical protein